MLGRYIKVDGLQYPNPTNTQIAYENNEKVNKSEAGTDLVSSIRLQKLSITFTFQVSSYWKNQILSDCRKLKTVLDFGGNEYNGRLRINGDVLAVNSEYNEESNGYWTLTVVFTER